MYELILNDETVIVTNLQNMEIVIFVETISIKDYTTLLNSNMTVEDHVKKYLSC